MSTMTDTFSRFVGVLAETLGMSIAEIRARLDQIGSVFVGT